MTKRHIQDGITLVIGVWLIVSPFVLVTTTPEGTSTVPMTATFVLSGAAAVVLAVSALYEFRKWEEWLDIVLGLFLIAAPWLVGFASLPAAPWNAVICGVLILVMGTWTTVEESRKSAL